MMKLLQHLTLFSTLLFSAYLTAQDLKIYVSDAENFAPNTGKIIQYDIDGSNPQVFVDEEMSWPQDIVFIADQNVVLISNLNSNRITRHNASTGAYIDDFATVAGGPTRMQIRPDGFLYVLQWSATDNNVLRYNLDGTFEDEYTNTGVPRSIGMAWDDADNLYVSSFSQANVTQFDSNGDEVGEFIDNAELSGPTNLYIDGDGNFLVFDWNDGNIERYNGTGGHIDTFIDGLGQVEGVDFLPNGNSLIGNGSTAEVKQYNTTGTFIENTVETGAGGLEQPNAVVIFDRSTLSVPENGIASQVFVTPSVSSKFSIHKNSLSNFSSVKVYNTLGLVVKEFSVYETHWDASHLSEGIYFVVGMQDGRKSTQKIIVKK